MIPILRKGIGITGGVVPETAPGEPEPSPWMLVLPLEPGSDADRARLTAEGGGPICMVNALAPILVGTGGAGGSPTALSATDGVDDVADADSGPGAVGRWIWNRR